MPSIQFILFFKVTLSHVNSLIAKHEMLGNRAPCDQVLNIEMEPTNFLPP